MTSIGCFYFVHVIRTSLYNINKLTDRYTTFVNNRKAQQICNVDKWRREQSLKRTLERRPDLLEQADLSKDDEKYLKKLKKDLHDQA